MHVRCWAGKFREGVPSASRPGISCVSACLLDFGEKVSWFGFAGESYWLSHENVDAIPSRFRIEFSAGSVIGFSLFAGDSCSDLATVVGGEMGLADWYSPLLPADKKFVYVRVELTGDSQVLAGRVLYAGSGVGIIEMKEDNLDFAAENVVLVSGASLSPENHATITVA